MDIIIREGAAVLELLASEDETLLVWRNPFLVLDLLLDVVDGVRGLDLEGDGLASEGLDKDLHATTETKNKMKSGLFLDVVVTQSAPILKLFASKDQTLLVRRDSFLVLNLTLNVVDSVRGLDVQSDGLAGKCLHKDLYTTTQTKNQVKRRLFLDIVIGESAAILELLSSKDETLLVRRNPFLVLNLTLNVVDSIRGLDLKSDGLAGKCLYKDLHIGR